MKREILCVECAANCRRHFGSNNPYPGEWIQQVVGKAAVEMRCDDCGRPIVKGQAAVAQTIITKPINPEKPVGWEFSYLEDLKPIKIGVENGAKPVTPGAAFVLKSLGTDDKNFEFWGIYPPPTDPPAVTVPAVGFIFNGRSVCGCKNNFVAMSAGGLFQYGATPAEAAESLMELLRHR